MPVRHEHGFSDKVTLTLYPSIYLYPLYLNSDSVHSTLL